MLKKKVGDVQVSQLVVGPRNAQVKQACKTSVMMKSEIFLLLF
jgi:hypothetical protein